ncbi:MAG: patatin-like phospholipase family protein [Anaerolineae bacterium]
MRQDLRSVPFFSNVPDAVLGEIEKRTKREHYHKGDLVCSEGDIGDSMYIIESGQVKIFTEVEGQERVFSYLNPGNFFGESALLTGEPRSASVRVTIDSDLVVITKSALDELIEKYPVIAVDLSRELGRRLAHAGRTPLQLEANNMVAITGSWALDVAKRLAEITHEDIFLLDAGGLGNIPINQNELAQLSVMVARASGSLTEENMPLRLSALVQEYYWMIVAIPTEANPVTRKAVELADATAHFGDQPLPWLAEAAGKNYWHVPANDRMIDRIARRMAQRTVGVALSSGSARGLAHIGVLKVFEEEHIPIDMVAATSMGSIIGALYCAGHTIESLTKVARRMGNQINPLKDFSLFDFAVLPRSGFIRGDKMREYFRRLLDDRHFEDLETPLTIVATDVITGEEIIFDSGPLAEAVRASVAIIGVFEPAHVANRYLVDGGAVNPVPTNLLADRGTNIIVGSSVIPSLRDRVHRKQQMQSGKAPNILGVYFGYMEIMESEIIKTRVQPMQIMIQPDVVRYTTLDFTKTDELIAVGETAARQQIGRIRQMLAPRPRPRPGS